MTATTESVRLLRPPLLFDRLYADAIGESHFAPLSVAMTERVFAPPAPAFWVSSLPKPHSKGFSSCPPAGPGNAIHPRFACGSSCCPAPWNSRRAMATAAHCRPAAH